MGRYRLVAALVLAGSIIAAAIVLVTAQAVPAASEPLRQQSSAESTEEY